MNDGPANAYDMRRLTPAELAAIIVSLRKHFGWTQEQLADNSGRTVRTIQRVEAGGPSDLDKRQAVGPAFAFGGGRILYKTLPNPKAEIERIERETVAVSIVRFTSGRQVREFAEGIRASAFNDLIELPSEAEHVWAEMQDYFRDYGSCLPAGTRETLFRSKRARRFPRAQAAEKKFLGTT